MAKKNNAFPASSLHMIDVRIVEARMHSHDSFEEGIVNAFNPHCTLQMHWNPEEKLLRTGLQISVETESSPSQPEAEGYYHFNFFYFVFNPTTWFYNGDDGELIIDAGLQEAVAAVSYSTARGILISRFQGTAFQRFILPIINPNDLLERRRKSKTKGA
jgi:hypothetical protein